MMQSVSQSFRFLIGHALLHHYLSPSRGIRDEAKLKKNTVIYKTRHRL